MTPIANNAKFTPATRTTDVEQLLRDIAFALRMTRKVKADMLADRPETAKPRRRKALELTAGLGV